MIFVNGSLAQGIAYQSNAVSTVIINGTTVLKPIPGALIYVCAYEETQCTAGNEVSIYSNPSLSPLSQPVVADKYGNFLFYATSGQYRYTIYSGSSALGTYPFSVVGAVTDPLTVGTINAGTYNYAPISGVTLLNTADSTGAGYLTPSPSTQAWSAQLSQLPYFKNRSTLVNNSVTGQTCEQMASAYTTQVTPYIPNGTTRIKTWHFIGPITRNDIAETPAQIEECLDAYYERSRADGNTTVGVTTLPSSTSFSPPVTGSSSTITAFSATPNGSGGGTMRFTVPNAFTVGQGIWVTGISASPSFTGLDCSVTSYTSTGSTFTLIFSAPCSVGNAAYVDGLTGAAASANTLWQFPISTTSTSATFAFSGVPSGSGSTGGTAHGSTGAGANCNNNAFTVSAATSSYFESTLYCGGSYSNQANTGTAQVTPFTAWDPVTLSQQYKLEAVNDWIRKYPICSSSVTSHCFSFLLDAAQQLPNPSDPASTYDGTHPKPSIYSAIAKQASAIVTGGSQPDYQTRGDNSVTTGTKVMGDAYLTPNGNDPTTSPYWHLEWAQGRPFITAFDPNLQAFLPEVHRACNIQLGVGNIQALKVGSDDCTDTGTHMLSGSTVNNLLIPGISSTPTVGKVTCWKTDTTQGFCSTQPDTTGACTCN